MCVVKGFSWHYLMSYHLSPSQSFIHICEMMLYPNAEEVGHSQVVLSNAWPSLLHPNTRLQSILPLNTRPISQENNWKGSKQHHLLVFKSLFSSESYERKWKQKHKNFQQSSVQKDLNTYMSSKIKKVFNRNSTTFATITCKVLNLVQESPFINWNRVFSYQKWFG